MRTKFISPATPFRDGRDVRGANIARLLGATIDGRRDEIEA